MRAKVQMVMRMSNMHEAEVMQANESCKSRLERISHNWLLNAYILQTSRNLAAADTRRLSDADILIVIEDAAVSDYSGIVSLANSISEMSTPAVLYLPSKDEVFEIFGLRLGFSDVINGDFSDLLIGERIKAVAANARDTFRGKKIHGGKDILQVDSISLDTKNMELGVDGKYVQLTKTETHLLEILILHAGGIVTREKLSDSLDGHDAKNDNRSIDNHIKRIRKRIEKKDISRNVIRTVYGVGYRLSVRSRETA